MKNIIKIVAFLILSLHVFGCSAIQSRFNDKMGRTNYEKGLEHFFNNDYERAAKSFKKSISYLDDVAATHFYLGSTYEELGEMDLAVEEMQKSIQYSPNRAESYTAIAKIYVKQGKIDESIDLYLKTLSLLGDDQKNRRVSLYVTIGELYFSREEFKKAIPYFKKASKTNSYSIKPYFLLALSYENLKQAAKSIELYEKAESLFYTVSFPKQREKGYFEKIYNALGKKYLEDGLVNLAALYFKKALLLNSDYIEAQKNLLQVNEIEKTTSGLLSQIAKEMEAKSYNNALTLTKKLLQTHKENYKAYLYLGNIYFEKKNYALVIKNYKKTKTIYYAYNKKTDKALFEQIHTHLGASYTELKKYDTGLTEYINAYLINPKIPNILDSIKEIYDKKWQEAAP